MNDFPPEPNLLKELIYDIPMAYGSWLSGLFTQMEGNPMCRFFGLVGLINGRWLVGRFAGHMEGRSKKRRKA